MKQRKKINRIRERRQKKVRAAIKFSSGAPRLSVFRSHLHIYAQLIDDQAGKTLAAASSLEIKSKAKKSEIAKKVGGLIANKAIEAGIKSAVFDRGKYRYHGRVKALAEGAREAGLKI